MRFCIREYSRTFDDLVPETSKNGIMESRKRSACPNNLHSLQSKMMKFSNPSMLQRGYSFTPSFHLSSLKYPNTSSPSTEVTVYNRNSCLLPSLFLKYYGFQGYSLEKYLNEID